MEKEKQIRGCRFLLFIEFSTTACSAAFSAQCSWQLFSVFLFVLVKFIYNGTNKLQRKVGKKISIYNFLHCDIYLVGAVENTFYNFSRTNLCFDEKKKQRKAICL